MTTRGLIALTLAANAKTHCIGVALSGRWPTFDTNPLCSASEPRGASSVTSKPALASDRGTRAAPSQRVAVAISRTGMGIRDQCIGPGDCRTNRGRSLRACETQVSCPASVRHNTVRGLLTVARAEDDE